MHKRQFFTPLHLFTTPRTSRWVIGNEPSIYLFVLLYIQVLTNECLICVIMFFSCVISPSSNHCVLEPSAGYFTFLTRIMTASSVTWNSTTFRCPLKFARNHLSQTILVTMAVLHPITFVEILLRESTCTSSLRGREDGRLEEHQ